jgi:hypothetical protein
MGFSQVVNDGGFHDHNDEHSDSVEFWEFVE